MPPKAQKSKEAKAIAAAAGGKGKGKKKWSKGKLREKKVHRVVFDKATYDKVVKEVPKKMKVITVYNLIEQYKVNGALARKALKDLANRKLIKPVSVFRALAIYTPTAAMVKDEEDPKQKKKVGGGEKKKAKKEEEAAAAAEAEEGGDE